MLRNLGLMALVSVVVCSMASISEAGAAGRSFKVESSDGTKAGVAFLNPLLVLAGGPGKVVVHTPDGDVNGVYNEPAALFVTTVTAGAFDNGYIGTFNAIVLDFQPLKPGTALIFGVGVGSTGVYTFSGTAKN